MLRYLAVACALLLFVGGASAHAPFRVYNNSGKEVTVHISHVIGNGSNSLATTEHWYEAFDLNQAKPPVGSSDTLRHGWRLMIVRDYITNQEVVRYWFYVPNQHPTPGRRFVIGWDGMRVTVTDQ